MTQTLIIKREPCFKVMSIEDQVTKHFYHNDLQSNPNERDYFEDEQDFYSPNESVRPSMDIRCGGEWNRLE